MVLLAELDCFFFHYKMQAYFLNWICLMFLNLLQEVNAYIRLVKTQMNESNEERIEFGKMDIFQIILLKEQHLQM